jgi:hypothetical protein
VTAVIGTVFILHISLSLAMTIVAVFRPAYGVLLAILLTATAYDIAVTPSIRVNPAIVVTGGALFGLICQSLYFRDYMKTLVNIFRGNATLKLYYTLIAVFFAWWLYGILVSNNIDYQTLLRLFQLLLAISIYPLALVSDIKWITFRRFLFLLVIISAIAALIALLPTLQNIILGIPLVFYGYGPGERLIGAFGQYVDATGIHLNPGGATGHAGMYFVLVASICLIVWLNKLSRIWSLFFFILFAITIAATFSRASYLAFFLSMAVIWHRYRHTYPFVRWGGVLLFIIIFVLVTPLSEAVVQRVGGVVIFHDGHIGLEPGLGQRLLFWGQILERQFANIIFTLFGFGYSQENLKLFTGVVVPHSAIIGVFAWTGILGLGVLLTLWAALLYKVYRISRTTDSTVQPPALALLCVILGWIIIDNTFSGESFFSDRLIIPYWGLLGLIECHLRRLSEKNG